MTEMYTFIDSMNPFLLLGLAFVMLIVGHLLTLRGELK